MPKTVDFCDGPKCGWQRPVTEAVIDGKRRKFCDECLKLAENAAPRTLKDVVDGLIESKPAGTAPPSASTALLLGFFFGIICGAAVVLLALRPGG